MGHTGMAMTDTMVLVAMITAIVAPTGLFTAPTEGATTVTGLDSWMAGADTADGDGLNSSQLELLPLRSQL